MAAFVTLTIILNHKNSQYTLTLPFLHTLPIIVTNRKASFSDLAIFGWLLWINWSHQIIRKEERFAAGSVWCHLQTLQFQTRSEMSFRTEFPTSEVPGVLTFLCCLNVHLRAQCDSSVRLVCDRGSGICDCSLAAGAKVYGKGLGFNYGVVARMGQVPAAGGEKEHSDSGQKTFCTAVPCLKWRRMDERSSGEALTAKALCSKRLGD